MYPRFIIGLLTLYFLLNIGCRCGDLRHKIDALHLTFFERSGLDTLFRPDYQEIPQSYHLRDSILVFEFYYDITWTHDSFNGNCEPGYNGTADSIASINFFAATNGDTINIDDQISGVSETSLVTTRKTSSRDIYSRNHCSLWKNSRKAIDDYILQYNTYYHKAETEYDCLLNPIRLQLNLKQIEYPGPKNSFFMVTEFASRRKLYSNAFDLYMMGIDQHYFIENGDYQDFFENLGR